MHPGESEDPWTGQVFHCWGDNEVPERSLAGSPMRSVEERLQTRHAGSREGAAEQKGGRLASVSVFL